jgi:hypothetical protein
MDDLTLLVLCKTSNEKPCGWMTPPAVRVVDEDGCTAEERREEALALVRDRERYEEAVNELTLAQKRQQPGYDGKTVYGNKYESTRNMTTAEIAKAFRADVKAVTKAGKLPKGLKLSVRTRYFAGGSSIDVTVKGVPAGYPVVNPSYDPEWRAGAPVNDRYSPEFRKVLDTLKALLDAYNFDGSDTMTDYFHVRFYGHVNVGYRLGE